MKYIVLVIVLLPELLLGQSNLLLNGGFEGNFQSTYPQAGELFWQNPPPDWIEYKVSNSLDDERWLVDSFFVATNPNLPVISFGNGYFGNACTPGQNPYDSTNKTLMEAGAGRFFVGLNHSNDGTREGFQQPLPCILNSGDYRVSLKWARAFPCEKARFRIHLSRRTDRTHTKILTRKISGYTFQPGTWYDESENFTVKLNKNRWENLDWLVITGGAGIGNNNWNRYTYFDDVRLFRPCDIDSACFPATGQICPRIAVQSPLATPFRIYDIQNANSLRLRITTAGSQVVVDTTYTNPNGLPDFYWPGEILGNSVASGTYLYEIALGNKCGAFRQSAGFTVLNGIYDTLVAWVDTTAFWSETPLPCCLHTLTLRNLEIKGDVDYIVKDTIWIRDGVSAAAQSNILIQAGQVIEMDSVEFDGTLSTIEIREAPCVGCRIAPPISGGTPPDPAEIGTHGVIKAVPPAPNPGAEPSLTGAGASLANEAAAFTSESRPSSALHANLWAYPNPCRGAFSLEVKLGQPGPVRLTVYNAALQPVTHLVTGETLPAGVHHYRVELDETAAGIFFVQLIAAGQTQTEKIVQQ
ncbi:MAG: T9SS type A sorting domain-containing protein [Bacteroidota bacterium]